MLGKNLSCNHFTEIRDLVIITPSGFIAGASKLKLSTQFRKHIGTFLTKDVRKDFYKELERIKDAKQ